MGRREEHFLQQRVATFLNLNNIDIDAATLWIAGSGGSGGSVSVGLSEEGCEEPMPSDEKRPIRKPWWKFF